MALLTIVLVILSLQLSTVRASCEFIVNKCYKQQTLITLEGDAVDNLADIRLKELIMDYHSDTLNYIVFGEKFKFAAGFRPYYFRNIAGQYVVKTGENKVLLLNDLDLKNPSAIAIDRENHVVYVGNSGGVYIYNTNNEYDHQSLIPDIATERMFFKNKLYYTNGTNALYTYNNGTSTKYAILPMKPLTFVVDKDEDVFFIADNELHYLRNGSDDIVKLEDDCRYQGYYWDLSTDVHGNAYVCYGGEGIYAIVKNHTVGLTKISRAPCYRLAFDKDNNLIVFDYSSKQLRRHSLCKDAEPNAHL